MTREDIMERLEEMDEVDIIELWNQFCEQEGYETDRVYRSYELRDVVDDLDDFLNRIDYFCSTDGYFLVNYDGQINTTDDPWDRINNDDLADWIEYNDVWEEE